MLTLFRFIPLPLRLSVYFRLYSKSPESRAELYKQAPLALAPGITMNLSPGDCAHRPIAYTGIFEWPVTKRLAVLARSGGMLIDVGANAGYFSLLWAALNPGNHVEAFEALPSNVTRLQLNVTRNGMSDRIQVHPFALGKTDGEIAFECGPAEQSGWGGIAIAGSTTALQVPVHRLDGVLSKLTEDTTIKIDCEGADPWVLEGARELLSLSCVRNVFFEVNEPRQAALGIPLDASQAVLRSLGFRCEQIAADEWHACKD